MICRARFSHIAHGLGIALLLQSGTALAEPTGTQRAAAEGLFQQATELMDQHRYAEACEKFAASQELDAGLGTMLYLADCYDQAGRSASAWALFHEAADAARRANQPDRERIAQERAANLEAHLSKLELKVPAARRVPGLELRINDSAVPSASWNAPLPVDPGVTRLEARAPGKKPWHLQIKVLEGPATQSVEVPQLADAPPDLSSNKAGPSSLGTAPANGSAQRTVGYVMGAAGIVAVVAGGFFGYRAYSLNKQSKGDCRADDPNACTPSGVAERESAKTAGALSTIATVSGALMIGSGITLVATAPARVVPRGDARQTELAAFNLALRGVW